MVQDRSLVGAQHVREVADAIAAARSQGRTLHAPYAGRRLTLAEGYAVQQLRTRARLSAGERVVGWKLGYTSAAMRMQMGVDEPNHGPLTDRMLLATGAALPRSCLQPRAEPEVALVLAGDLAGPVPRDVAAAAVGSARAAIEIVDSVWTGYRFDLADNTADGSSAAWLVVDEHPLDILPTALDTVPARLERNGTTVGTGTGADALGHPLDALAWLSARLGEDGVRLRAGEVVITGGLTAACPIDPGDVVTATVGGRSVSVRRPV